MKEVAATIIAVAAEEYSPVALCISPDLVESSAIKHLSALARQMARCSTVPVEVTFSDARCLKAMRLALDLGFSSIMFDGSFLPFEQNLEMTAKAVEMAARAKAFIGGGIGAFSDFGKDDSGNCLFNGFAERFVKQTGVDSLLLSLPPEAVENGRYSLDIELLDRLRASVPGGLMLHDASLLVPTDFQRAISAGVTRLSFSDCLRVALSVTATGAVRCGMSNETGLGATVRQILQLVGTAHSRLCHPLDGVGISGQ